MKKNQNGFGGLEVLLIILVVSIVGALSWHVWSAKHKTEKVVNGQNSTLEPINLATNMGVTLYKPSVLPAGYLWWTTGIINSRIDEQKQSSAAGDLGKFLPKEQSDLELKYIKNFTLSYSLILNETKYAGNFDPTRDCITPASINAIAPCKTITSASGNPIYINQNPGLNVAFYMLGSTLIYISYDGASISDMLTLVNSLHPSSVKDLDLTKNVNPEVDKHFSHGSDF